MSFFYLLIVYDSMLKFFFLNFSNQTIVPARLRNRRAQHGTTSLGPVTVLSCQVYAGLSYRPRFYQVQFCPLELANPLHFKVNLQNLPTENVQNPQQPPKKKKKRKKEVFSAAGFLLVPSSFRAKFVADIYSLSLMFFSLKNFTKISRNIIDSLTRERTSQEG